MEKFGRLFIIASCIFSAGLALHPQLNESIKHLMTNNYRQVLSTASGTIVDTHSFTKVVKLKTNEGIFLEIYHGKNNVKPLISKIKLPDQNDGYFIFQGQSTNLALDDLDGDNKNEIIVPSFDRNLIAHLNVYRFNEISKQFELYNKKDSQ
ncbi:MAG: hypothetical protein HOO06_00275 [Bdellovibrionaceae bacterium]|jgi:hypothetical protein|nr:hypothetical protein [Pseudobdellovibrionaceae bacterium]